MILRRANFACIAISLFFLARVTFAQEESLGVEPVEGLPSETAYAKTTRDSVAIAGKDVWYLEEFDSRERPLRAVRWENGEISERTSWLYHDSSDVVRLSVRIGPAGSTEIEFDTTGKCVRMAVLDALSRETNYRYAYDAKGRMSETETNDPKKTVLVTYAYREDGSLSERKVFTNGKLSLIATYSDDDNWVETAYFDGVPILVVEYVNGVRRKGRRE